MPFLPASAKRRDLLFSRDATVSQNATNTSFEKGGDIDKWPMDEVGRDAGTELSAELAKRVRCSAYDPGSSAPYNTKQIEGAGLPGD